MVNPICFAYLSNLQFFSADYLLFTDRNARSSAKSRSSNWEKRVHWIPLGLSDVVFRMMEYAHLNLGCGGLPALTLYCHLVSDE